MFRELTRPLRQLLRSTGFDIIRYPPVTLPVAAVTPPPDPLAAADAAIYSAIQPFTMTSRERVQGAIDAARYVAKYGIPGAIVECGVWRGGSTMAMALALIEQGDTRRDLYLFDTYAGMPPPTAVDQDIGGMSAADLLSATPAKAGVWCHATLEDVRANLKTTGYPESRLHFIRGKVEETLPHAPLSGAIALLRLDTDWYESTRHELTHLFPQLSPHGVLIIDDYGHWQGSRLATDEFLAAHPRTPILLQRTDYTARMAIKPATGVGKPA
jgi:predicted O-methyltransferase YrrM